MPLALQNSRTRSTWLKKFRTKNSPLAGTPTERANALARVTAFMHGRTYVLPDDVREIFADAARHRIARSVRAQAENIEADHILGELLQAVPIP